MQGPAISVELGAVGEESRVLGGLRGEEAAFGLGQSRRASGSPASGGIAFGAATVKGQGPRTRPHTRDWPGVPCSRNAAALLKPRV